MSFLRSRVLKKKCMRLTASRKTKSRNLTIAFNWYISPLQLIALCLRSNRPTTGGILCLNFKRTNRSAYIIGNSNFFNQIKVSTAKFFFRNSFEVISFWRRIFRQKSVSKIVAVYTNCNLRKPLFFETREQSQFSSTVFCNLEWCRRT